MWSAPAVTQFPRLSETSTSARGLRRDTNPTTHRPPHQTGSPTAAARRVRWTVSTAISSARLPMIAAFVASNG